MTIACLYNGPGCKHTTHRHYQLKWMLVDPDRGLVFLHHVDAVSQEASVR